MQIIIILNITSEYIIKTYKIYHYNINFLYLNDWNNIIYNIVEFVSFCSKKILKKK